jgi:hypothetical protein
MKLKYLRHIAITTLVLAVGATTTHATLILWSETPADGARPDRNSDPVEVQVRREILSRQPELRQKSAPFLRVEIPEPVETPRLLSLREQPADSSTPVTASGIPARPVLPVAAPAK